MATPLTRGSLFQLVSPGQISIRSLTYETAICVCVFICVCDRFICQFYSSLVLRCDVVMTRDGPDEWMTFNTPPHTDTHTHTCDRKKYWSADVLISWSEKWRWWDFLAVVFLHCLISTWWCLSLLFSCLYSSDKWKEDESWLCAWIWIW